jgi:hypothetical protein
VAWAVGNDKFAFGSMEISVCYVDRYSLLPFIFEAIQKQCWIDGIVGRAMLLGVAMERRQLIVVNGPSLDEQSSDERALAVIDATASHKAKHLLGLMPAQKILRIGNRVKRLVQCSGHSAMILCFVS